MSENTAINRVEDLLGQMQKQIDLYMKNQKRFPTLVSDIDAGLHNVLQEYSVYIDSLREDWRTLEEVNALALDEGSLEPLKEHESLVCKTLMRMSNRLQRKE